MSPTAIVLAASEGTSTSDLSDGLASESFFWTSEPRASEDGVVIR